MTLAEATNFLAIAKTAYTEALKADSYSFNMDGVSRSGKRQSLDKLLAAMNYWQKEVDRITNSKTGLDVRFGTWIV